MSTGHDHDSLVEDRDSFTQEENSNNNPYDHRNRSISPTPLSPTSIKKLYPNTSPSSISGLGGLTDNEDDEDEDIDDIEAEETGKGRHTFDGRLSELSTGMLPNKLHLSVTGPPPNVHIDAKQMVILDKPQWKLKQRCCFTSCKYLRKDFMKE